MSATVKRPAARSAALEDARARVDAAVGLLAHGVISGETATLDAAVDGAIRLGEKALRDLERAATL
ncbi:MAG TPA: hypothetical protein VND62_11345 [Acidimicrobiales bacterium]|nr:hypothetical protein [Acidimicrobiales bacterium]